MIRFHKVIPLASDKIKSLDLEENGKLEINKLIDFMLLNTLVSRRKVVSLSLKRVIGRHTTDLSVIFDPEKKFLCTCRDRAMIIKQILDEKCITNSVCYLAAHAYNFIEGYGYLDLGIGKKEHLFLYDSKKALIKDYLTCLYKKYRVNIRK